MKIIEKLEKSLTPMYRIEFNNGNKVFIITTKKWIDFVVYDKNNNIIYNNDSPILKEFAIPVLSIYIKDENEINELKKIIF